MGKNLGEKIKLPSFKDGILLDIGEIDPNNKEKINEYAKDAIEYARRLENAPRPAILRKKKYLVPSLHPKHINCNNELIDRCAEAAVGYAIKTLYHSPLPLILQRTHIN